MTAPSKPPVAFGDVFLLTQTQELLLVGAPNETLGSLLQCHFDGGHKIIAEESAILAGGTRLGNAFEWARERMEKEASNA